MPVNTPQLNVPIFAPQEKVPEQTFQPMQNQPAPQGSGYVSKAGAGAFVANSVLQGWMKGREVAKANAAAKEANEQSFWNRTVQQKTDMAKTLQQTKPDSPEAKQAYQDMMTAWHASLQAQQKYVQPEEGQKKNKKQKFEGVLGQVFGKSGITPHDIPAAALKSLAAGPPPGFMETQEDINAKKQGNLLDIQTRGAETDVHEKEATSAQNDVTRRDDKIFTGIMAKKPEDRGPTDLAWLAAQQQIQDAKDGPDKVATREITSSLLSGKPLTPGQKQYALAHNLIPTGYHELTTKGNKQFMTTFDNEGNVLRSTEVGWKPDASAEAMALMQLKDNLRVSEIDKGLPSQPGDYDDKGKETPQRRQRVWNVFNLEQTRNPAAYEQFITNDPVQKNADLVEVSKLINATLGTAGGAGADKTVTADMRTAWSNFFTNPQNSDGFGTAGLSVLTNPKRGSDGTYQGDLDEMALAAAHQQFVDRFRVQVQKAHPNWGPAKIQDFMQRVTPPPSTSGTPGEAASEPSNVPSGLKSRASLFSPNPPPPGSPGPNLRPATPAATAAPANVQVFGRPGPGVTKYNVTTTDGVQSIVYTTPDIAQTYIDSGADVTEE